jgi:DNA-binding transcriptional MerR regulator
LEAAQLLGVSPNVLRLWEREFGFPSSGPSVDRRRRFLYRDVISLREALQSGLSLPAAISLARGLAAARAERRQSPGGR